MDDYSLYHYVNLFYRAYKRELGEIARRLGDTNAYGITMELIADEDKKADEVRDILNHLVATEFKNAG